MLRYTGSPLVDVGVATILAFSRKKEPKQLAVEDLERIAQYIAKNYIVKPLRSFLTVVFPNSGFTQPAYFNDPEKQYIYADRVLRSYRPDIPHTDERDIFLGASIPNISFDVNGVLAKGRAFRQHIPLVTAEDVINFFPYGEAGMPISGEALLAIQAFPLGCAKVGGKILAVHSDNPDITYYFARKFLESNLLAVQMAQQSGDVGKLEESHLRMRTLIIDTLLSAAQMQVENRQEEQPFSITAYHLSNSGQGPSLNIYHLPSQVIGYLQTMLSVNFQQDWGQIVNRAWELPIDKKGKKYLTTEFSPKKNYLYEDLFQLPGNAKRFIRTYFLRVALQLSKGELGDPRRSYSTKDEVGIISWKMTNEFLRRIMFMEKERIDQIRELGDRLADYISGQNDKRFFQEFFTQNRYDYFRSRLLKANLSHVKRGNQPIVEFDPYVQVFEEGTELARSDWRLARDLVVIRMVERLYVSKWFDKNPDVLSEEILQIDQEDQQTSLEED